MEDILEKIKSIFREVAPKAKVILFGSQARGDAKEGSDVDLMVIVDKETLTFDEEMKIAAPLYSLEFETGKIISPHIVTSKEWENASRRTTLYYEVMTQGIVL